MRKRRVKWELPKSLILVILGIVLIIALLNIKQEFNFVGKELSSSVESMIIEDAKAKFPNAKVEIINKERLNGDYLITLKVVYFEEENGIICPKRYHTTYIYPKRGFANLPLEEIFTECRICEGCEINLVEEAIVKSLDNYYVRSFAKRGAIPSVEGEDGGEKFLVKWKNEKEIVVEVSKDGEVRLVS